MTEARQNEAYDHAHRLAAAGRESEAREVYNQLRASLTDPALLALVRNDLATIDAVEGQLAKAREGFMEALVLDPYCHAAHQNLAALDAALADGGTALAQHPATAARTPAHASEPTPGMPIFGFMHVALAHDWEEIVADQLALIHDSGLYAKLERLFIGLVGPDATAFSFSDDKVEVLHHSPDLEHYEFPTLKHLHRFCKSNTGLVFYIHTKGVFSGRTRPHVHDWRRYMQYFIIEQHDRCVRALADHDVCGVNWQHVPWPHFSGNFWWATSSYIRSLPPIDHLSPIQSLPHTEHLKHGPRHDGERWIGANENVRVCNLHHSAVDHYVTPYPRQRYEAAHISIPTHTVEQPHETSTPHADVPISRRPVYGFMHVAMVDNWRSIVDEQIVKLQASGLWDKTERLYVGLLGPYPERFNYSDEKIEVVFTSPDIEEAELPTLAALQNHCQSRCCLVYYIHTKGVTNQSIGTTEWRHVMEYFTIMRYQDNLRELEHHDICGINWAQLGWCQFYAGNFWWARSEYIESLPDIRSLQPMPGLDLSPRHVCERWIGEHKDVRPACLYQDHTDHYANQSLPRSRYARIPEVVVNAAWRPTAWSGLENRFQDLLEPVDPIKIVVEIGVEYGFSLFSFAAALPDATVLGVDPYDALPTPEKQRLQQLGKQGISGTSEAEDWVRSHLPQFPNALLLKTTSEEAARQFSGQIDVLHIDAVHTYEDVARDFGLWEPQVRPGGCVLFHDTESFPDDVGRFFKELPGRKANIKDCHGLGVWYKPYADDSHLWASRTANLLEA